MGSSPPFSRTKEEAQAPSGPLSPPPPPQPASLQCHNLLRLPPCLCTGNLPKARLSKPAGPERGKETQAREGGRETEVFREKRGADLRGQKER